MYRIANQSTAAPGSPSRTNCGQPRAVLPAYAVVSMATGAPTTMETAPYGLERYHETLLLLTTPAMPPLRPGHSAFPSPLQPKPLYAMSTETPTKSWHLTLHTRSTPTEIQVTTLPFITRL